MSNGIDLKLEWDKVVGGFPPAVRGVIDSIRLNQGRLGANEADRVCVEMGCDLPTLMMRLLDLARLYAVTPVSQFKVGAVAAGLPKVVSAGRKSSALYLGANFEFSGLALSYSIHAEQSATNHAWLNDEAGIQQLAVSSAPCGYCRQFLYELGTAKNLSVILPAGKGKAHTETLLTTLLPQAFGPADLKVEGGLMAERKDDPELVLRESGQGDELVEAARLAAARSYAPYPRGGPHQYAGVAVQLKDGSIYRGRYAENAAHNPSFSPLASALALMNLGLPPGAPRTVVRCVLVEVPTVTSQLEVTRALLQSYAPKVKLDYRPASVK